MSYIYVFENFQAFTEAGLSPGFHTMKHAEKRLQERKKELDKAALPSTKRRRLILKHDRAMVQGTQEVVEGDTYDSGSYHFCLCRFM